MGFNDWNRNHGKIDERVFTQAADSLVSTGLAKLGYRYVNVDGSWQAPQRDADGNLAAIPTQFPNGMKALGDYIHSKGLKFGIYTAASTHACNGAPASYGHFTQDANEFASWGVDYVKADYCRGRDEPGDVYAGDTKVEQAQIAYTKLSQALRDSGRPMVFSESAPATFFGAKDTAPPEFWQVLQAIAPLGQLWRIGVDVADSWTSIMKNYSQDTTPGLAAFAGPGSWNDPDFLEIGNGGLSLTEEQSHFTLWSELAAPLIISTDISQLSPQELSILSNKDVIDIDQDPLGAQGTVVQSGDNYDVLARPLANGDRAVVLFNKADKAQDITTTATTAGFDGRGNYLLKNLVTKQTAETTGAIAATVPAHGTVIYRVTATQGAGHAQAAMPLTLSGGPIQAGTTSPVTVTVRNDGPRPVENVDLRLEVTTGGTAQPTSATTAQSLRPGSSMSGTWDVTPTAVPPGSPIQLRAVACSQNCRQVFATATDYATPYTSLAQAFNNVGVTNDMNLPVGDFTGLGSFNSAYWSYSAQALAASAAHVTPGSIVTAGGATFTWPSAAPGTVDNVAAQGQTIDVAGTGTELAFLGAGGYSAGGGTVTVTYTDRTTSQSAVNFPQGLVATSANPAVAIATPYVSRQYARFPPDDKVPGGFIYVESMPLLAGKAVSSITLPDNDSMHIFAVDIH